MPPLLLVRHARAGTRGTGPSDLARPLDERGRSQAAALPDLLLPLLGHGRGAGDPPGAAPSTEEDDASRPVVASSPARRCIETVTPLAVALGTLVTVDEALVEGADARQLHERLAALRRPTVWSSHGDVIPELLAMLARRGLDLGPDASCRKGSTWVLDVEGGTVRDAHHLPPPA